tara:strand:+ start:211 stop:522 length:312 start_codon:yes stop_codon:yes gene_type:complete
MNFKIKSYHIIHNMIIDMMSIIHFLIYLFFGILIKNKYKLVLILSILWEVFEYIVANIEFTKNLLVAYWPINIKYWNETNVFNKLFDLIFNMMGYYIGNQIEY